MVHSLHEFFQLGIVALEIGLTLSRDVKGAACCVYILLCENTAVCKYCCV